MMHLRQRRLIVSTILGLSTLSSVALADPPWVPSHYRCTYDQITTQDQARGRQLWSERWANVNPYNRTGPRDEWFLANLYRKPMQEAFSGYTTYLYPVYTDPNDAYQPWKGPGAVGSTTASSTGDQISALDYTVKPIDVYNDGICEPGCYTPEQRLLFTKGPVEIDVAQSEGRGDLMTLSPESTLDNLRLVNNRVQSYTLDQRPAHQTILTFNMVSGGSLSVTEQHALVTPAGNLKKAVQLKVGDSLVKQDGSFDRIKEIVTDNSWYGRVYNLRPVSTDLTSNILVAEGYLNGSIRFQSEYVEEMNRLILRHNIPEGLIPGRRR